MVSGSTGCQHLVQTYPLQQLALHEGFDYVVGGGEVPGLVGDVDRLEPGRERILQGKQKAINRPGRDVNQRLHTSASWPAACPPSSSARPVWSPRHAAWWSPWSFQSGRSHWSGFLRSPATSPRSHSTLLRSAVRADKSQSWGLKSISQSISYTSSKVISSKSQFSMLKSRTTRPYLSLLGRTTGYPASIVLRTASGVRFSNSSG